MKNSLVQKLRIYAMIMRLRELEEERILKRRAHFINLSKHEPLIYKPPEIHNPIFYENEPSKFISKPRNNFKKI